MRSGRDRARWATLVAVVGALVTVVAVGLLRFDAGERHARADTVAVEAVLRSGFAVQAVVANAQQAIRSDAEGVALDSPQELTPAAVPGLTVVDFVPADAQQGIGVLQEGVVASEAFDTAARAARDTGTARLTAPVADVGPLIVVPFYDHDDGTLHVAGPDDTTPARRASIAGYVAGVVDVTTVGEIGPTVDGLEIADQGVLLAVFGDTVGDPDASDVLEINGRIWTISSHAAVGGIGGGVWALVALVVLAGVGAVAAVVRVDQRRVQAEDRAEREAERSKTIADLVPILQRSHQLADVLPSLGVQLSQRFALAGISIVAADGGSETAELFVFGERPHPDPPPIDPGRPVDAGQSASLTLSRANRVVAELLVVAGERLDHDELEAIQACAELVTSAIVTAQAVDRQRRAMAELTELDALKSVFLSTAAHELKTPVTAVGGLASVLAKHWDDIGDAERMAVASRIATNSESLGSLVQDLLDFSRLEDDDLRVAAEPLDLAPLVEAVVERQALAWQSHSVVVEAESGPDVLCDPIAIERITTNLVSNAVKYSPRETTVTVAVRHAGGHAELVVDDEGPGVAVEDRERIFERFFRGDGPEVVATRGVGIGLSVVREFVRKLGGVIVVDDAPGGGARFICRFPHLSASDPTGTDSSLQDLGGSR